MKKELIYDLMNGFYNKDTGILSQNVIVEDEFEKGKECGALLEKVYGAKIRLAEKLGHQEDKDVEIIVDCMNEIMRILCLKMYDYGKNEVQTVTTADI